MNDMTGGFASGSLADAGVAANFRLLQDVDVKLTVEIGSTHVARYAAKSSGRSGEPWGPSPAQIRRAMLPS